MRIHHKISQHRRDFQAVYECEHCGDQVTGHGYDDEHFHQNVIPGMACKKCLMTAPDNAPRTAPDVPAWKVI